jgi:hypothetical protein
MTAALLDTNAVSDLMRDHSKVKTRVGSHPDPVLTSVVVSGEIRYGLSRLPPGKKRNDLEARALRILVAFRIEAVNRANSRRLWTPQGISGKPRTQCRRQRPLDRRDGAGPWQDRRHPRPNLHTDPWASSRGLERVTNKRVAGG